MAYAYRLASDLQADLTWLWCESDAALGVCSTGNIEHRGPPPKDVVNNESGVRVTPPRIRLALAGGTRHRGEIKTERWARKDDELRLMWQELVCHGDSHVVSIEDPVLPGQIDRTPMPAWARRVISHDRKRAVRVHATIRAMVQSAGGPAHERVLWRVYGPEHRHPLCYGVVGHELANLVEYTDVVARLITPSVTPTEAGETVLGRRGKMGPPAAQVTEVRRQANALLEAASRAYSAAHDARRAEKTRERESRVRRILAGAA
jgi:hypothetical protein